MAKFPFRGVSEGVSWDSSHRDLRCFHECLWRYLLCNIYCAGLAASLSIRTAPAWALQLHLLDTNPPSTGQLDGGTNNFRKQSCTSEFVAYSTWTGSRDYSITCPVVSKTPSSPQTDPAQAAPSQGTAPFASCCSGISSWRVHSVCSATLIDRFIFQSIYLLNYPRASKDFL